jgi:hypothetical protein
MNRLRITLLAALCVAAGAQADPAPGEQAALHFLDDYYAALKRHDAPALSAMIAPEAPVVVLLNESGSEQKFTLTRAEYLQQIRSVWHFTTQESYTLKNISYKGATAGGTALVTLEDSENRTVLGGPSGQRNQLEISLAATQGSIRIVAIRSHSIVW